MEVVFDYIEQAGAAIIFCIALSLLLLSSRESLIQTAELKEMISESNTVYEQMFEYSEELASYDEVIGSLLTELAYDVQIVDDMIVRENYTYLNFDLSRVEKRSYKKTYEYDASGNIEKVIYK